jgi:hypothetical protein
MSHVPGRLQFCVSTTVDLRPDENISKKKRASGVRFSLPLGRWALAVPLPTRHGWPATGRGGAGAAGGRMPAPPLARVVGSPRSFRAD